MSDVLSPYGRRFSQATARSKALYWGVTAILAVDSMWVHVLLTARSSWVAWFVDAVNVVALASVWLDFRAMGKSATSVDRDQLHIKVGWKYDIRLARDRVARAFAPTFRDLPQWGSAASRDYINVTKPATPNVLLELSEPTTVRQLGIIEKKAVRRIAMWVDDPVAFLETFERVAR